MGQRKNMEDRYVEKYCVCGNTFPDFKDGKEVFCSRECKERDWKKRQAQSFERVVEIRTRKLENKLKDRDETIKELRDIIKEQTSELLAANRETHFWKEMAEGGAGSVVTHFKYQIDIRQEVINKYIAFFNDHKHEWETQLGRQYDQPTRWPPVPANYGERA